MALTARRAERLAGHRPAAQRSFSQACSTPLPASCTFSRTESSDERIDCSPNLPGFTVISGQERDPDELSAPQSYDEGAAGAPLCALAYRTYLHRPFSISRPQPPPILAPNMKWRQPLRWLTPLAMQRASLPT